MQVVRQWMLILVLAAALFGPGSHKPITVGSAAAVRASSVKAAPVFQTTSQLVMTGPTACPSTGCVSGQRMSMRFQFAFPANLVDPNSLQPPNSNVRICIYATTNWGIAADTSTVDTGEITQASYTVPTDSFCDQGQNQLTGYSVIRDRVASIPTGTPKDALDFSFRFGTVQLPNGQSETSGYVIARMFPLTAPNTWAQTPYADDSSALISAVPLAGATTVYAAKDGAGCAGNTPCYINSDGDGAGGLGTGLRDAIEAPGISTINIVGNYPVKTQTVLVDRKITITGSNGATITFGGPFDANSCAQPMLSLTTTATLRGLYINGGNCTNPKRNLIDINSATPTPGDVVLIESNDLTGGANAVTIRAGTTNGVIVRYNLVTNNTGFVVLAENGPAPLEVVANNFINNGSTPITAGGPTIQCASGAAAPLGNRRANHNYWDSGSPDPNTAHCTIDPAKRLGSPVALNTDAAGVRAALVQVTDQKTSAAQFDNRISYNYSGTGSSPFNIYIVDYGYMPLIKYNEQDANDAPFSFWGGGASPSPCSNYWDVFLAGSVSDATTLNIYFKYFNNASMTPSCVAAINSVLYCAQTTAPEKYPLFWLDPTSNSVTGWWNPVGAPPANQTTVNGQLTACHTDTQEIQVSLSNKRRPALSDLGFTPFVVGIPVIKSFGLTTSSQTVIINWATNNEADVAGFNILRGTSSSNLTPLYATNLSHYGSASSGYASYVNTNTGLTNGTVYYYRLKVIRSDGNAIYSDIQHITVNVATPIPPTPTLTATPIRPTSTPPFTAVPTRLPTQPYTSPTPQPTFTITPTLFSLPTLTDTAEPQVIGAEATLTAVAIASVPSATPSPAAETTISATPENTSTASLPEAVAGTSTTGRHPWLSLLLGLLAGLVLVIGTGGWWYRSTHR